MNEIVTRDHVRKLIIEALREHRVLDVRALDVEKPWKVRRAASSHGDYTCNVALVLAWQFKSSPHEVAQRLLKRLPNDTFFVTARKGFLNFRMNDATLQSHLQVALSQGTNYGTSQTLSGKRALVEFVSADPDGPLEFSLGRIAVFGDALCRLLTSQGANVTREWYLNDDETSSKMKLLGESVASHYLDALGQTHEPPEGLISDGFVRELGVRIAREDGNQFLLIPESERAANFAHRARDEAVVVQRRVLERLGVRFEVWTSESALKNEGRVENALIKLRERGLITERDGAQWLQTTQFGDDADRVLVRAGGRPTYLASDIAYHIFKNERGFDLLLNIWTGEHKPYIERTRAALSAAGCDAQKLEVLTVENARLLRDGRPVSRGASGDNFSLDEALNTLDADTLKFFFLRQNPDERIAIDDEIARRDDETNPAYAVRLLPTRLQTMISQAQATDATKDIEYSNEEREVARLVALWPDTIQNAAQERAPHRIAAFLVDLANATREVLKSSRPDAPGANREVLQAALVVAQSALSVLGLSGARV